MKLGDIVRSVRKDTAGEKQIVNIIEFIESPWGLGASGFRLYPVQRVILKAYYGLALDDNPYGVDIESPIPRSHAHFDEIAGPPELDSDGNVLIDSKGNTVHYYKHRVTITDERRQNKRVFTEAGYLRFLHAEKRCNVSEVIPGVQKTELVLSVGRRSGKSFMASCILAYENYKLLSRKNPQAYYGMPSHADIQIITVATGKEQASLLYQTVSSHFNTSSYFAPYWANNTQSYARFQTPFDIEKFGPYAKDDKAKASLKITFSPCKAKSVRGAANIVIVFDEFAHFGERGENSAEKVYEAATPSKSTFSPKDPNNKSIPIGPVEGRVILISTPMGRQGHFYKRYQDGYRGGTVSRDMLCIEAPTWEVNPTLPASELEQEYLKNATTFFTEYGARFSDRTRGFFDRDEDVLGCIDPNLKPRTRGVPKTSYFLGFDLGLVQDSSAVAVGHIEHSSGEPIIVLDYVDSIQKGVGKYVDYDRLEFDDVADWLADICSKFSVVDGVFDKVSGVVLEQALAKRGISKTLKSHMFTPQVRTEIFTAFKHYFWDRRLAIYDVQDDPDEEHSSFVRELLSLQETQVSKNVIDVRAPRMAGMHDDRTDACARMVWLASKHLSDPGYVAKRIAGSSPERRGIIATRSVAIAGGSSPERQFLVPRSPGRVRGMRRR